MYEGASSWKCFLCLLRRPWNPQSDSMWMNLGISLRLPKQEKSITGGGPQETMYEVEGCYEASKMYEKINHEGA